MQTPELSRPSSRGKVGYIIALVGSALSALSFLAIPFVSIKIFGFVSSFSLLQLVQFIQTFSNVADLLARGSGNAPATPLSLVLGSIWISLIVATVACIVALIFTLRASSRALGGAISLIALGLIGAGIFLFIIIVVNTPYTSAAVGGWLCLLGMIATAVGGIVALVGRPPVAGAYGYGSAPQYQSNAHYPQQTPPPPPPGW